MKNESEELQRHLEQATSRGPIPGPELDSETAQLRDAWNALGRLLEAASDSQRPSFESWTMPPPARTNRRALSWAIAMAASLLVCAVALWAWYGGQPAVAPQSLAEVDAQGGVQAPSPSRDVSADELKWDDSLDEQLVEAQQRVIRVRQDWGSQLVAMAVVDYQWEQVRQDVEGNPL
jgi:hypothetical protein